MIKVYKDHKPCIDASASIAENCMVIGRCSIGEDCSIWYNAILRADVNEIVIGKGTNIQDGCVVHCDEDYSTRIGENVTVGHMAIIHGCTIGSNCIVGMGSTILDGAVIGDNVIIGANSLVTSGKHIPSGVLAMGSPARVVRELTPAEIEDIRNSADGYKRLSKEHSMNGIA